MKSNHIKKNDVNDINFQLGVYFRRKFDFKSSERYLRYAANTGNQAATKALCSKVNTECYLNEIERINLAAIDILEQLVTPSPSEKEIGVIEKAILEALDHLHKDDEED